KDKILPDLEKGMVVDAKKITPNQHFTQPPPRYTEARLVMTMEEQGIGRPSTYAPTIDTIQRRNYVSLENKRLIPTELCEIVNDVIVENFPEIINIDITAKMEKDIDSIEESKVNWIKTIHYFYKDFHVHLEKAEKEMKEIE